MKTSNSIALIQLPYPRSNASAVIPLGLIMLGTVAKQHGYRVKIIDLDLMIKQGKLDATSKFFKSSAKKIVASDADIYGFSPMCHSFPASLLVAKECKKLSPQKMIIFGGPEASFQDTKTLSTFHFVDLIVRGEGEHVLLEVLDAFRTKSPLTSIRGITYRKKKQIIRNRDQELIRNLDTLPYPDYSLHPAFKSTANVAQLVDTVPIEGGRGCPYACTFCSTRHTWRGQFRLKTPRRIADEIRHIKSVYGKGVPVELVHDNFAVNRKALLTFCKSIPQGVVWRSCARIDLLDNTIIKALKNSGCSEILIGIDSGSPRMQKYMRKHINLEKAFENILLINESGIRPRYSFISGFPKESISDFNKNIEYALRCACLLENVSNVQLNLLTLPAASTLYQTLGPGTLADMKSINLKNIMLHWRVTKSSRELNLIRNNKHMFPSFYLVKSDHFTVDNVFKMNEIYAFLLQYAPLTTRAILKAASLTPVDLAKDLITSFECFGLRRWGLFWVNRSRRRTYMKYLWKYIKATICVQLRPNIDPIYEHESALLQSLVLSNYQYAQNVMPKSKSKLGSYRPRLSSGVLIRTYHTNLDELIEKEPTNASAPSTIDESTVFAYVPKGDSAHSIILSPLAQSLIEKCDGSSSITDIKRELHREFDELNYAELSNASDVVFRSMIEDGVLTIGSGQ